MKLSKRDKKQNDIVLELLKKDSLTYEEKSKIFNELNEGVFGDINVGSAFFTGLDLAMDFTLMITCHSTVLDLCSGFGVLSFSALIRHSNIKKLILLERDKRYLDVSRKLVESNSVEIVFIQGDMFDKEHGKIDCIISNPPYGKMALSDADRSWLKYTGAEMEVAAMEIGLLKAEYPSFIIPQGSCEFRGSGRPYFEECSNKKISKLKKDIGMDFYMSWSSVDTSVYEQNFKNTTITVECCTLDREI